MTLKWRLEEMKEEMPNNKRTRSANEVVEKTIPPPQSSQYRHKKTPRINGVRLQNVRKKRASKKENEKKEGVNIAEMGCGGCPRTVIRGQRIQSIGNVRV